MPATQTFCPSQRSEVGGSLDAQAGQSVPQQGEPMVAERQAETAIVGDQFLVFRGRWESSWRLAGGAACQDARQLPVAECAPEGFAAMSGKAHERAGAGQQY